MQNAERKMQNAELGKREEGKQIYISLLGNPLIPHPSSLKLYILLVEDEKQIPTVRWGFAFKGEIKNDYSKSKIFIQPRRKSLSSSLFLAI